MAEVHTYKCKKCGQTMQRSMSNMMMWDYLYLEGKRNRYEGNLDDEDELDSILHGIKIEKPTTKIEIDEETREIYKKEYEEALARFEEKLANNKPDPVPTVCDKCGFTELEQSGCILID